MDQRLYFIMDTLPDPPVVVYVGLAKNPRDRLTRHLKDKTALGALLRDRRITGGQMKKRGLESRWVGISVVDAGPSNLQGERTAIRELAEAGHPLLNKRGMKAAELDRVNDGLKYEQQQLFEGVVADLLAHLTD